MCDAGRQRKDRVQPDLQTERHWVIAGLERIRHVARQMSQTGLVGNAVALLAA